MGTIDTAIYTRLKAVSGVTDLVVSRIYPPPRPQNPTAPLITYEQNSADRSYRMGNQTGIVNTWFSVTSWDDDRVGARALADAVRLALSNYSGTSDSVVIDHIEITGESDGYDPDMEFHYFEQEYWISYRESLPT